MSPRRSVCLAARIAAGLHFVLNVTGGYRLNPVFVILMMKPVTGPRVTRDEAFAFGYSPYRLSRIGSVTPESR